jgi:hypothetical protein
MQRRHAASWPLVACGVGIGALATLLVTIPDIFIPDATLGWVDAWYYVSLSKRLPESLRQYPYLYQVERITWTLPAYVVHLVGVAPLAANYITKSLFFIATVLFLFGALRQTCNARTAAFVSSAGALYSFLVHALGANYVDGAAIAYLLMATYTMNRALLREGSAAGNAFIAGVCYLALLVAHLVFILVLPLWLGYIALVLIQADSSRRPRFSVLVLGFVGGVLAAYLSVVALYAYWGIHSWPLLESFRYYPIHGPNGFVWPYSVKWALLAAWLLLPTTAVIWILPSFARALRGGWRAVFQLPPYYWLLVATYAAWAAAFLVKSPLMMLPFYTSYLIPFTFLALGPVVMPLLKELSSRAFWCLLALLYVLAAASYRLNDPRFAPAAILVAVGCLAASVAILWRHGVSERMRAPAFLVLLIVAVASIDFATADYNVQLRNGFKYTAMAQIYHEPRKGPRWTAGRADAFDGIVAAGLTLTPRLTGKYYYFWYDGEDPMGMFFRSIGSFFFAWSTDNLLNEDFPRLSDQTVALLAPKDGRGSRDLLILSRSADVSVRDPRIRATLQWTEELHVAGTPFFAHYFAVDASRDFATSQQ